jgi:ketosteroid isomerase-like protein
MIPPDLRRFIEQYHVALDAFFRGDPQPAKALYSHRNDASLANPFTPVASGWGEIEAAMDRAAVNYADGAATGFDTLAIGVGTDLAYMLEVERFRARVGGSPGSVTGALRVTTVLRLEGGSWRIVHRHADPITTPRDAASVVQPPAGGS